MSGVTADGKDVMHHTSQIAINPLIMMLKVLIIPFNVNSCNRTDDVTVNLLADGEVIDTVKLSEENNWNYGWTKLDKKAAGKEIDYTVTEDEVPEYTTKIEKATDSTFTYTVTNSHKTEETEVKVKKVWNDADDQDGYRPDDVTVNLLADGKIIDTVTLSEENEWSYSWTKLDKKANGTYFV